LSRRVIRGPARRRRNPKDGERVFTTETQSTQSSEYFYKDFLLRVLRASAVNIRNLLELIFLLTGPNRRY
jgi:hypothetical protein